MVYKFIKEKTYNIAVYIRNEWLIIKKYKSNILWLDKFIILKQ